MCGRYRLDDRDTPQDMQAIIDALNRKQTPVKTGDIFPGDVAPVVANSRTLSPAPFAMRWGYALGSRRVINARSETAHHKGLFADGMLRRRCLIPASRYFEWQHSGREKTKYEISDAASPMLFMAGLYRIEENEAQFTILTRAAAPGIAHIHDRMPVLLPRDCLEDWLSPQGDAQAILARAVTDVAFAPAAGQVRTISFL